MALPSNLRQEVEQLLTKYCEKRVPHKIKDQVRVGFDIRGNSLTLFEERPQFRNEGMWVKIVVAQFRFDSKTSHWTLFCADRNSRWHEYIGLQSSKYIEHLLREVDRDPTRMFWG